MLVALGVLLVRGSYRNRAIRTADHYGHVTATEPWVKTAAKKVLPASWIDALREAVGPGKTSHFDKVHQVNFSMSAIEEKHLETLRWMPHVESLRLWSSPIEGPGLRHLKDLPNLKSINCSESPLKEIGLEHLGRIAALEKLYLNSTPIQQSWLRHLEPLENLTLLRIGRTAFDDDGYAYIAGLKKLEYLDLTGTQITDAGLHHLHAFPNLGRVILYETDISVEAAENLRQAMPDTYVNHGDY